MLLTSSIRKSFNPYGMLKMLLHDLVSVHHHFDLSIFTIGFELVTACSRLSQLSPSLGLFSLPIDLTAYSLLPSSISLKHNGQSSHQRCFDLPNKQNARFCAGTSNDISVQCQKLGFIYFKRTQRYLRSPFLSLTFLRLNLLGQLKLLILFVLRCFTFSRNYFKESLKPMAVSHWIFVSRLKRVHENYVYRPKLYHSVALANHRFRRRSGQNGVTSRAKARLSTERIGWNGR